LECVPPPFHVDHEFFEHGAVIYEFIEGSTSKLDSPEEIVQMARYVAKIHTIDYQIIPDGFEQAMQNYLTLKKTMNHIESDYPHIMNPTISEAFKQALGEYRGVIHDNKDLFPFGIRGIIHGDLFNNYITDPQGKLWLIDWENSEYWDILDEVCTFIIDDIFSDSTRGLFIREYKKEFPPVEPLNLEDIGFHYTRVMPAFNVCFGMDQMASNLQYKLDPERKLRDVIQSGRNWGKYFTKSTSELIQDGIRELTEKLVNEYNLNL
jgi:thiamine kinase-like enzyme